MPEIINAFSGYAIGVLVVVGLVLVVQLCLIIFFIYEMISINKNTRKTAALLTSLQKSLRVPESVHKDAADELIKYKSLLDNGAITQEEFDFKKAQFASREFSISRG